MMIPVQTFGWGLGLSRRWWYVATTTSSPSWRGPFLDEAALTVLLLATNEAQASRTPDCVVSRQLSCRQGA
jgi:hypothetical protein